MTSGWVHEIVTEHGEIEPATLYEAYESRVEDPKTNRTVRNWLEKLERYNLLVSRGEKRGRSYAAR